MADIHSSIFDKVMSQRSFLSMYIIHLAVISSETVVLVLSLVSSTELINVNCSGPSLEQKLRLTQLDE